MALAALFKKEAPSGAPKTKKATKAGAKVVSQLPRKSFDEATADYKAALELRAQEAHVDSSMNMKDLNLRYSTAVKLGKLAHKSIVIIGIGGIGTWITRQLVGMGATNITIVDYDVVEIHNVGPQSFDLADLGKFKVDAMGDAILRHRFIKLNKINEKILGWKHLVDLVGGPPDILICAADSMELRNSLADSLMGETGLAADLYNGRLPSSAIHESANKFPELFVNTAMSLGVWNVFAMPIRALLSGRTNSIAREAFSEYRKVAVFPPEEAVQEACTERAIVYTGAGIAAYVCALLHHVNDNPPVNADDLTSFMRLSQPGQPFKWLYSFDSRHHVAQTPTPFQMRKDEKAAKAGIKALRQDTNATSLLALLKAQTNDARIMAQEEYRHDWFSQMRHFVVNRESWELFDGRPSNISYGATLLNVGKMVLVDNSMLYEYGDYYQNSIGHLQPGKVFSGNWTWKTKGYTWAFVLGMEYNDRVCQHNREFFGDSHQCLWVMDECNPENIRLIPVKMACFARESYQEEKDAVAHYFKRLYPSMCIMPWDIKPGDTLANTKEAVKELLDENHPDRTYLLSRTLGGSMEVQLWMGEVRTEAELEKLKDKYKNSKRNAHYLKQTRNPIVVGVTFTLSTAGVRGYTPSFQVKLLSGSPNTDMLMTMLLHHMDVHIPMVAYQEPGVEVPSAPGADNMTGTTFTSGPATFNVEDPF